MAEVLKTKLSALVSAWAVGDKIGALRIASRFPRLGDDDDAIRRAWDAHQRPAFYHQIKRDPGAIVAAGLVALSTRYNLGDP